MDPLGAQQKVLEIANSLVLNVSVAVAHEGISTYLGAAPIVRCLEKYQPNVYELGWNWDELEHLAQGSLAGHLLECGCQLTGGISCIQVTKVPFPILVTKVPNTKRVGSPMLSCTLSGNSDSQRFQKAALHEVLSHANQDLICLSHSDIEISLSSPPFVCRLTLHVPPWWWKVVVPPCDNVVVEGSKLFDSDTPATNMQSSTYLSFVILLIAFALLSSTSSCYFSLGCNEEERQALVNMKESFKDPSSRLSS
ncbi:hypothetical protein JHK87_025117 [Glycine soja]|nr:hypothetical protein JHK87_025117 [Glycine soja]